MTRFSARCIPIEHDRYRELQGHLDIAFLSLVVALWCRRKSQQTVSYSEVQFFGGKLALRF